MQNTLDTSGTFRCFLTPTRGPWGAAGPGAASPPAPARGARPIAPHPIRFGRVIRFRGRSARTERTCRIMYGT